MYTAPEEGASQKQGESSAFYDNAQGRGDMQEQVASRNPGSGEFDFCAAGG